MANTALPRVGDAQLQRLIGILEDALNAIEAAPLAGVTLLPPVPVDSIDTRVYHGLGRPARGYWVVGNPAGTFVFDGRIAEIVDPFNYFTLRATVPGTVSLAVF
jgi:hypothetical protein